MVQLDVLEYSQIAGGGGGVVEGATPSIPTGEEEQHQQPQGRRLHLCFEGSNLNQRKKSLKNVEQVLRSGFGVHFIVPGRNQAGPVAVVGKSYNETLPAMEYLMHRLIVTAGNNNDGVSSNHNNRDDDDETQVPPADVTEASVSSPSFLEGRIMRNVKDPNDVVLSGRFLQQPQTMLNHHHRLVSQQEESSFCPSNIENNDGDDSDDDVIHLQSYWLFESESWSIMVCPLTIPSLPEQQQQKQQTQSQTAIAEALQVGFDNLRFQLGNAALSQLEIFLHTPPNDTIVAPSPPKAFASGDPASTCIQALYREILQTRVV